MIKNSLSEGIRSEVTQVKMYKADDDLLKLERQPYRKSIKLGAHYFLIFQAKKHNKPFSLQKGVFRKNLFPTKPNRDSAGPGRQKEHHRHRRGPMISRTKTATRHTRRREEMEKWREITFKSAAHNKRSPLLLLDLRRYVLPFSLHTIYPSVFLSPRSSSFFLGVWRAFPLFTWL